MSHYIIKIISMLCLAVLAINVNAADQASDKVPPKELSMVLGFSLGPYAIENGRGMLVDVISASFEFVGQPVRYTYMTNNEAIDAFEKKLFDGVAVIQKLNKIVYYSDPLVRFENYAISLEESKLDLQSIDGLNNFDVVGFSGASRFLGEKFTNFTKQNENYIEVANQEAQVSMLLNTDVDVIIADKYIFQFYLKKIRNSGKVGVHKKIVFHDLFPATDYLAGFHSENNRDKFNRGLRKIRDSGLYEKFRTKYMRLLQEY